MVDAEPISALVEEYSPELLKSFPGLEEAILDVKKDGTNITAESSLEEVRKAVDKLHRIGRILARGIKEQIESGVDPIALFLKSTEPARKGGNRKIGEDYRVGIIPGPHRYHVLEASAIGRIENDRQFDILIMLQGMRHGLGTKPEVHGEEEGTGGIEVYLPLVDDITFDIGTEKKKLNTLEGLATVLPGDVHHLGKFDGHGPLRTIIISGFGFSRGTPPIAKRGFQTFEPSVVERFTKI